MMRDLPTRKQNRLKGYDYTGSGAYFITICVKNREEIFANIPKDNVGADIIRPQLTQIGNVIENGIMNISQIHSGVDVTHYVIMPNHVHMIIEITCNTVDGRMISAPTNKTISKIIGYFKQYVSRDIKFSPWQKSFHDHIIRRDEDFARIAQYIENNPSKWEDDCFYTH